MSETDTTLSVAVVGISARVPGASTIEDFWQALVEEKDLISFFTDEELRESRIEHAFLKNPQYIKAKGVIKDPEHFDASFFGYAPSEAALLDPQQRIFLECAWHAMEDAGYDPYTCQGRVGVFGGAGLPEYHLELNKHLGEHAPSKAMSIVIGNEKDYLATRVAYKLHLSGSTVTVQCACSTSLTAIILGMQSLLTHQNDMVLCGGVSIGFPQKKGYLYEKGGLDSPDGYCRSFDANANGTVFSSGAGIVLLKRLDDAVRDGDHIYCVIKGGSINNDGGSKSNYTAPSIQGQMRVEVDALELSGVHPETISYVEAHGTGTHLGDPIEVKGLTEAFRKYTSKNQYCAIGSVKTNIGHTDTASGVIALIKVALSLSHKFIPASLHFKTSNPNIDFENSPFYVNTKGTTWEASPLHPRRALVNSFGVGGANACVIVEEAPKTSSQVSKTSTFLLPISAKTITALKQKTLDLLSYIHTNHQFNVADFIYTLQVGRTLFECRKFIVFSNKDELVNALEDDTNPAVFSFTSPSKDQDPIFLFPGQGNQYSGMGKYLYETQDYFRDQIDLCCDLLGSLGYEYNIKGHILGSPHSSLSINETVIAQPALFITEYSLCRFILSLGISPKAMIGHSIGEIVAACIAGVIELADALHVVAKRAKLTQNLEKGAMLAVFLNREKLAKWVVYPLEMSVFNSPNVTIISGPIDAVKAFEDTLSTATISYKRLATSHAFHSHMMDPAIAPLKELLSTIKLRAPSIPIISTVTGDWMTPSEAMDPEYWAEHARKPVNFLGAALLSLNQDHNLYLEMGPGHSLETAIKNCDNSLKAKVVGLIGNELDQSKSISVFYNGLGKIWAYGGKISFQNLYYNESRNRLALPLYPFEKQKYVFDFKTIKKEHSEIAYEKDDWFYQLSWKKTQPLLNELDFHDSREDVWIIFGGKDALTQSILNHLADRHEMTILVKEGNSFIKESDSIYSIQPAVLQHYLTLFDTIKNLGKQKYRIIHLWNVSNDSLGLPSIQMIESLQEKSFYGLLYLEQALIKLSLIENLSITFVGDRIYDVLNDEVNVSNSLMIGPCRVLKNEYHKVQSRLIDIVHQENESEITYLSQALIAENYYICDDIVVAYRNRCRWVPIYEQNRLPLHQSHKRSLKEDGVYIITGGTGAIGLHMVECIATKVKAKIVLLYRSALPEEAEWDIWLERHPQNNFFSNKIRKIKELQKLGSQLILVQADVTSYSDMEQAIHHVLSEHQAIDGILHCAGIAGGGVISLKQFKKAEAVLKPKVLGTLILHNLTKNLSLDFFICYSSVTAILGEEGQIDYCSANAFLDAFANHLNHSYKGRYLSINWGAWSVVGMAAEEQFKKEIISHSTPRAFNRLINLSVDQETELYELSLDPENDWFIDSHRLNKIPTLVGVAFFEFLIEYARKKYEKYPVVTFSNVLFVSPLMFFPGIERVLQLQVLRESSTSSFKFFSISKNNNLEHMQGQVSFSQLLSERFIDIDRIMTRLSEDKEMAKIHEHEDQEEDILWYGIRWKTTKRVFVGEKEWLGHFFLPSMYAHEVDAFALHPALLDFASCFAAVYFVDDLYLPFSYKEWTFFAPLEREIYSYITQNSSENGSISFDIQLVNKQGKILVEIKEYLLKKVLHQNEGAYHQNVKNSTVSNDLSPEEGMEAFDKILHCQNTSQVIICKSSFFTLFKENTPSILEENKPIIDNNQVKYSRPQLFTPYVAPSNEIEKGIAKIWESILGLNGIGIDDNFIELGGNSLTGIQVVTQLAEIFKVELSADVLMSNPTIRGMSDFILNKLIDLLEEEEAPVPNATPNS